MKNLKIRPEGTATSEEIQLAMEIMESHFSGMVASSFPTASEEEKRNLQVIFTAGALAGVIMSSNTTTKAAHLAVHENINWFIQKGKVNA